MLLKRWPFVDPGRVGSWGWSGGGSMSLNALFRHPDLYRTAIAIAPVADQRLYDTIYQERYMGLPADNEAGYRDGSPLTHAGKHREAAVLLGALSSAAMVALPAASYAQGAPDGYGQNGCGQNGYGQGGYDQGGQGPNDGYGKGDGNGQQGHQQGA